MYIKDTWELLDPIIKGDSQADININILNSLVFLYSNALRPEELEADVLPLYEKFKIKHDVYTY